MRLLRLTALCPAFSGTPGPAGYRWYVGATAATVDYQTPIAFTRPGAVAVTIGGLGLSVGETKYLAARAVSASGVEEENTSVIRRLTLAQTGLQGQQPNAIAAAEVLQAAGGKIRLRAEYSARRNAGGLAPGAVAEIQVARRLFDGLRWTPDWADLVQAIPLRVPTGFTARVDVVLDAVYAHGTNVRLAVRAAAADGAAGPQTMLPTIAAASDGPADCRYARAEQYTGQEQLDA